ncbi:hypothetical protein PLICRDRAFT_450465 [Plicaturopsis crispa FD-325 SS-3]|uniref:Uncharacterized protein n=1 Tax=Plicaturopsis crispa FD-325 SS-3 TaxID=944288 RepID=A0A0C9T271_PLICR|nr:hypothetical protein PLICRDRAFT_450465 [Plicaturopsis crispa FD-325 SS-3]
MYTLSIGRALVKERKIVLVISEVLVCAILTLRVYALYQRDRRILTFVLAAGLVAIGISGWSFTSQKSAVSKQASTGCHMANTAASGEYLAIPWEMLFTFDCMIFGLTLRATYHEHRRHRGLMLTGRRLPLAILLLRDGALYFGVMALANLSNILTFYLSSPLLKGCLSTFASNFSVLLMSRLMLNMHKHASPDILTTDFWTEGTHRSPIVFLTRMDMAPGERPAHTDLDLVRVSSETLTTGSV